MPVAKDVHDDDEGEDPLTQINVDVEPPSIVSVITVTRPGTSAADSEPSTLEPQLSVRGLAGASAPGSHFAPGTIEAPAGADTGEEPEDKTTDSIDARLLEAYESARSVEAAVAQRAVVTPRERRDVPELKPIIITPSEPFRITASGVAAEAPRSSQTKTPRRAPAPIPAAGRPPEVDPELAEPTVKRAPYTGDEDTFDDKADSVENAGTAPTLDVARPRARAIAEDEDTEDETATDAMQKRRTESREELSLSDALPSDEDGGEPDDEEEDETRTQHDVSRALRQGESGAIGSLPGAARSLVGLEEARLAQRHLPASSAAMPAAAPAAPPIGSVPAPGGGSAESGPNTSGATIRMLFNASLGAVTVNPPPRDQGSAPPHSPMPPPRAAYNPSALPSAFADTVHVSGRPPPPPAPTVRRPPTPHFDPLAKPKRSRGRKFFFFLLFVAAGGAGYHFRHRATPWVMKHLPASLRPAEPAAVPPPPVAPTASAAPPDPSAASASPSASPSASASASASASPSASPSSSAHGKKRPRR